MAYSADMSDLNDYWFDASHEPDPVFPPLPRADRRKLLDPAAWRAAERNCAVELARAAMAIGRLDGLLAGLDETVRAGLTELFCRGMAENTLRAYEQDAVALRFILNHARDLRDAAGSACEAAEALVAAGLRRGFAAPTPSTLDRRIAS